MASPVKSRSRRGGPKTAVSGKRPQIARSRRAAPQASARARQVASANAAFNRPKKTMPAKAKATPKASSTKSTAPTKAKALPTRAMNPGGSGFKTMPAKAKPQVAKLKASARSQPHAGARARALTKRPPATMQKQIAPAPAGGIDLLKGIGDAIGQLGSTFGRNQIRGAMDNPATRAGGVNKYIKSK